jgi:hypothetical protein
VASGSPVAACANCLDHFYASPNQAARYEDEPRFDRADTADGFTDLLYDVLGLMSNRRRCRE